VAAIRSRWGNGRLAEIIHALEGIPHITRIRLHTRLPVVLPERIDDELLELLRNTGKAVVTVIHANHAQEIDASVDRGARRIARRLCRPAQPVGAPARRE
jgi:L-lysine 2,3-aminomutase